MIKKKIVTIVGAGVIGAGWAARMLACGLIVNAYDPSVKARKQLLSNTKTALKSLQRLGLNKNAKLSNLKIYSDLRESLHSTTFVQENAPENEKLKKKLLKDIDKLLPKNIIIASSSSGLLPTRIQSLCNYPERVCIGHPFNPVYLLPLVELVSGKQTKKNTITRAKKFYEGIGMKPLIVKKEIEGYISDRLQEALWREALHIIKDIFGVYLLVRVLAIKLCISLR